MTGLPERYTPQVSTQTHKRAILLPHDPMAACTCLQGLMRFESLVCPPSPLAHGSREPGEFAGASLEHCSSGYSFSAWMLGLLLEGKLDCIVGTLTRNASAKSSGAGVMRCAWTNNCFKSTGQVSGWRCHAPSRVLGPHFRRPCMPPFALTVRADGAAEDHRLRRSRKV